MKFRLRTAVSAAVAAAVVGGGFFALAPSAAFAAGQTAPSWEPDADAAPPQGNIAFYDANGVQVTSGTNLNQPWAYAAATTPISVTGATKATLSFAIPGTNGPLPSAWSSEPGTGSTTFSPSPTGTPADLASLESASTPYAVNNSSGFSINTYIGEITAPTGQYANITQVRLSESGAAGHGTQPAGTYWESDIAYNTTSSATTVDGTTVPANGWAVIFPFSVAPATATTLTSNATGGNLQNGNSLTLSATTAASASLPGYVVFEDNGTPITGGDIPAVVGGPTTFTYTPPSNSTNSYTASFVPAPPSETGANTSTATETTASTSSSVPVNVTPPQTNTNTTLSDSAASITFGASETLTSTVSAVDSTNPAGTLEFLDGTTPITGCTSVPVNPPASATCTTTALPQGTDSVTAVFTATSNSYANSTSPAVVITVAAPAACSLTGSSCSDTQNITVTVNPGTITITTPYTSSSPFVLPAMSLSTDGTYLYSQAPFPASSLPDSQQIVVTSTLAPAYAWTLSVAATNLSDGSGGTIASTGLGLTNGALLNPAPGPGTYPGTVTFSPLAADNPTAADNTTPTVGPNGGPLGGGAGLNPTTPQTFATTTAANGTAEMQGVLTLLAPTSTPPGTYTGTITFSVS